MNSVYSPDVVTAKRAQFWFRRFRSGNFDVKDAPLQDLNIAQKTVWNHLNKAGYKK